MKKILFTIILLLITIDSSYACKIQMLWNKIPTDFSKNCYENKWIINPPINWIDLWNWLQCIWRNTFNIISNQKVDTFLSEWQIIPHKLFKKSWDKIKYSINLEWNYQYLNDNNYKTHILYDTSTNKTIKLIFDEKIKSNTFNFNLDYSADNFKPSFSISKDWETFFPVNIINIKDYDIKYLNITFYTTVKHITNEKIKIKEISFTNTTFEYLVKTRSNIEAYSNNICKNNYPNLTNNKWDFNIDSNTKSLLLELKENKYFNPSLEKDTDNDWVLDINDNCVKIYNPKQKDKNWNWKWDLCSDDDKDNIIWNKDNCIYVYNPNQKDINRNWVWDKCEFDKDKDWIFDTLDNCINKANSDQKDKDKDWIWDICDNSIYYNPSQIDKNNNWIWDITEEKEKQLKENDNDNDWIINYKDNCKNIANSDQLDSDNDWVWNVCDNCIDYQNHNQLDYNKNWIWDICEDSDNDWIEWLTDNCINITNSDQKDSDNDWIWNACEDDDYDEILASNDNCPFVYNPKQIDIDKDWLWDKCDEKDNRYIESNSNFFIWLLIFIVLIFWTWIFMMIRKLK